MMYASRSHHGVPNKRNDSDECAETFQNRRDKRYLWQYVEVTSTANSWQKTNSTFVSKKAGYYFERLEDDVTFSEKTTVFMWWRNWGRSTAVILRTSPGHRHGFFTTITSPVRTCTRGRGSSIGSGVILVS